MRTTTRLRMRRRFLAALVAASASLVLCDVAQAADDYGIVPKSFSTTISTHQAGAHPDLRTKFSLNVESAGFVAGGGTKAFQLALPKGLIGAPTAVPTCPLANIVTFGGVCPRDTMVGTVTATVMFDSGFPISLSAYVYNTVPYPGEPAAFAFFAAFPVRIDTFVRPDGDYGVTATGTKLTEAGPLVSNDLTLWGVPADHNGVDGPNPDAERLPFLTNPTECSGNPLMSAINLQPWSDPSFSSHAEYSMGALTGCDELAFEPSLQARPTTNAADSPSGLDVDLKIPQSKDPDGLATANLRKAEITLPPGLTVNAASANGLAGCSSAQIGIDPATGIPRGNQPSCPDASRIGSALVETPLLADPLPGSVYLAMPHDNPFGSLLAIYLVINDPKSGVLVKLAGQIIPDPQTGRLTATFDKNPELPFEDLKVNFDAGAFAPLKTPSACGTYATTSTMTPWSAPQSGPPATPKDEYEISQGPNGQPCGSAPNAPSFEAGTTAPLAGQYKPFVINLRREDGTQQFHSVTVSPPPGLVAKLAGTQTCSDAALAVAASKSGRDEQANPSCPAASQVGTVYAQAGAGPAPYNAPGKVYLSGPYKGAPLSLAVVAPAVAGPFDLGTIVVRNALYLDSTTAQVKAVSDPIPSMLQGIPLDVRSISLRLDKPSFTLNPTSCDPTTVDGSLLSLTGSTASLQNRFQLAECGQLGFKPSLALSLKGGTKRGQYPALKAVLKTRPGDANISGIQVALPHSEFLAQNHIRTICTRVQFAQNACPARSVYGQITVETPLLDYPLSGPVYLRSSDNTLPDLVPDLHGPPSQPIHFEAAGRTDSINGGIRNTFSLIPDVPFTKLTLQLQGNKKGLLENSRDICATTNKADVSYTAHNGSSYELEPALKAKCGKAKKRKAEGKGKRHRAKHRG